MPVLGLDIGTRSLKGLILSEDREVLGAASRCNEPCFQQAGWTEWDPALWLSALGLVIPETLADVRVLVSDIRTMSG